MLDPKLPVVLRVSALPSKLPLDPETKERIRPQAVVDSRPKASRSDPVKKVYGLTTKVPPKPVPVMPPEAVRPKPASSEIIKPKLVAVRPPEKLKAIVKPPEEAPKPKLVAVKPSEVKPSEVKSKAVPVMTPVSKTEPGPTAQEQRRGATFKVGCLFCGVTLWRRKKEIDAGLKPFCSQQHRATHARQAH
jgi:hypothetical protein